MTENRADFCKKLCELLRETRAFAHLKELRWNEEEEYVTPIFDNGAGEPNKFWPKGYYWVNCRYDSNYAILEDVVEQFTRKHC